MDATKLVIFRDEKNNHLEAENEKKFNQKAVHLGTLFLSQKIRLQIGNFSKMSVHSSISGILKNYGRVFVKMKENKNQLIF